jgi:hypothetical protein
MQKRTVTLHAFRQSRWYRRVLWAAAVFLVYVLIGFFVLPPIIKSQLVKRLPAITKRQAAVRQVKFNPLALSLTIRGLSLTEPNGQVFASWEELYVNFQLSSIARLSWTFAEIRLKQPYGHLELFKDGRFNFANMMEQPASPSPQPEKAVKAAGLPRINIWHLHIDEGAVAMDDDTHRLPLHTEFKPINLSLTNLTTRAGKDSAYSFRASSDSGRSFTWAGTLMVQPFQSRGHFELAGGELVKLTPLLRDYLRSQIDEGRFNVRADYAVASGTNGFDATVTNGVIEVTNLKVKDDNNGEIMTTLPSLSLESLEFDLRRRTLHIGAVKIAGYHKIVRIEKDGTLNLNLMVEPASAKTVPTNTPPPAASAPWTVSVDDLTLKDGAIKFADLSRKTRFETTLAPIDIHVQRFTTHANSDAAYAFSIATEAAEQFTGSGSFCLGPLRAEGEIKLADLNIPKYAPYYQAGLRGEVQAGKVDAGAQYRFAGSSNGPLVTLSNAGVALRGLQLKSADTGETVVGISALAVERTEASLAERRIDVGLVKSSGGSILARQSKEGKINLLGLSNLPTQTAGTNPAAPPEAPWTALVREIAFDDYTIKIEDQKPAKPASLSLDQLRFNVKNLSTVSNEPITAAISLRVNEGGTATLSGTARLSPPGAEVEIQTMDLDLRPFQPYLNGQVRLGINSGRLNTQGRVRYALPDTGAPMLTFNGDVSLTNVATTDLAQSKDFVKWNDLQVSGIDFALQPNRLHIHEVKWRGLQTSVILGPDQRLNVQTILPGAATDAPAGATGPSGLIAAPATAAAAPTRFPIGLGALVLDDASLRFTDESIEPHCSLNVQELSGTVKDLSSQPQSTAAVDLHGKVDATSSFSVSGKLNPLANDLQLDLGIAFTNADLTAFSTYLEKYAGYPLNKGKLSMGLHYGVGQKQLKAENKFLINHFTLGAHNDSTNATHLPVKLAVALLKDRNGQINLDIPLSGRTDDPQFRVAPVIFKVVVNLIVKAATSPFSLLGALVGGGEELSFVEFEPGQAVIPDAEVQKVNKLVKALSERPALNLEIAGSFDPERDRAALARDKLEQQLKVLRLKELAEAGGATLSTEDIRLESADRDRLLQQLLTQLGTNQTLVFQVTALSRSTNSAALSPSRPVVGPTTGPTATTGTVGIARTPPLRSGSKGAKDLLAPVLVRPPVKEPAATTTQAPPAHEPVSLPADQVEARLTGAIQVSADEQRELVRARARTVQTLILKSGQVAPERLFIVTPKAPTTAAKGDARVNLSLD